MKITHFKPIKLEEAVLEIKEQTKQLIKKESLFHKLKRWLFGW